MFAAYGWDETLQDGSVLAELLALNLERAARWLVRRRASAIWWCRRARPSPPRPSPDCDGRGEFGVPSGRPSTRACAGHRSLTVAARIRSVLGVGFFARATVEGRPEGQTRSGSGAV